MTDLWQRLKQRKLVQWAVAYVAGAFAALQGVDIVANRFAWPEAVSRGLIIAACVGLFVTLLLAWYHGEKGQQKASTVEILILAVVLVVGGGVLWRYAPAPEVTRQSTSSETSLQAKVPEHSIAVLPFVNLSSDKNQVYFSDGISEDMLNQLAKVPELKVISRSSSFSFKGKNVPLKEIASALGVAYILEGSVQRAGNTLRISAQLVDVRRDVNVWSQRWDRPFDDVFAIQDEITGAVVRQLKVELLGKAQAIDPDAYATYLQARQLVSQFTMAGNQQAQALVQKVLEKAPDYAPAWNLLASIYLNLASTGALPPEDGVRMAREAIDRAAAVDPTYAPIYASRGSIDMSLTGDLASAAKNFEKAISLAPGDAGILINAGALAQRLGRFELAVTLGEAGLARDPVSVAGHYNLASAYSGAGRPRDAIAAYETVLRLLPGFTGAQSNLGLALLEDGKKDAALTAVLKEPEEVFRLIDLPIVYHALSRHAESDAILAKLIAKYEKEAPYNIAYVLAYRGEIDRAFVWLDKTQEYKDPGLTDIANTTLFQNLKQDPRWLPLLRKLDRSPEQLEKIPFNVALPRMGVGNATP